MDSIMIERTQETIDINSKLQIVKLKDQKFKVVGGYVIKQGYALFHPSLGFFSFGYPDKYGHILPYTPKGGKKVLQRILDDGGFTDFYNSKWLMPMK